MTEREGESQNQEQINWEPYKMATNHDVQHEKWYADALDVLDNPPVPTAAEPVGPANREDNDFANAVRGGIRAMQDDALQDAIDAAAHRARAKDGGRTR